MCMLKADMNHEIMMNLEKRIVDGEKLSAIENKMLIELQNYYYGQKDYGQVEIETRSDLQDLIDDDNRERARDMNKTLGNG